MEGLRRQRCDHTRVWVRRCAGFFYGGYPVSEHVFLDNPPFTEPHRLLTALPQTAGSHWISLSVQAVSSCMPEHTVQNSFSLVSWGPWQNLTIKKKKVELRPEIWLSCQNGELGKWWCQSGVVHHHHRRHHHAAAAAAIGSAAITVTGTATPQEPEQILSFNYLTCLL